MKKQKYTKELNTLLKQSGRKKIWLHAKLGIPKMTFWRKVSKDQFTAAQKQHIAHIIAKG